MTKEISLQEYAAYRRCLDWYSADPAFRALMHKSPAEAVKKLGFAGLLRPSAVLEAIRCTLFNPEEFQAKFQKNPYLLAFVRHNVVAASGSDEVRRPECFHQAWLYDYSQTQRRRCRMESAAIRQHDQVYYYPLAFELSLGCMEQCPFCGFAAKPWKANFAGTEDNRRLWREVVQRTLDYLGPVLRNSPLYFATEPLDNPDYELFLEDFRQITGDVPQTTTARGERDAGRVRELMQQIGQERMHKAAMRFSIRTLQQFYRIMELYSPEELVDVELLTNNPESVNRYSDSGRAMTGARNKGHSPENDVKYLRYSLDCVAGVLVNMVEKTISFIEPRLPGPETPRGYLCRETAVFTNARDYEEGLKRLMSRYAVGTMPRYRAVCRNPETTLRKENGLLRFGGNGIGYDMTDNALLDRILSGLEEGKTFQEIMDEENIPGFAAGHWFDKLQALYQRGYLMLR